MLTAVSNPKVRSVSSMSLSMVFGMPTTGTPASDSRCAAVSVPSPPIGMRASIPWVSSTLFICGRPSCRRSGATRAEPRVVPPRVSRPSTAAMSSGVVRSSSRPRQPSRKPTTSLP
jgi:hypothetical protein